MHSIIYRPRYLRPGYVTEGYRVFMLSEAIGIQNNFFKRYKRREKFLKIRIPFRNFMGCYSCKNIKYIYIKIYSFLFSLIHPIKSLLDQKTDGIDSIAITKAIHPK